MVRRILALPGRLLRAAASPFDLQDAHVYTGIILSAVGAGLVYMPAGLIVAGIALFYLGARV